MHKGDISNDVAPQWLFVWEDQVAVLEKDNIGRYKRNLRFHRYVSAVNCWTPEPFAERWLSDFAWRQGERFSLVTFLHGQHWAEAINEWADAHEIQSARCYYYPDRLTLARRLSTWPSVRGVVDPTTPGAYGVRGYGGIKTIGH